jgi:dCMP deaminase
MSLSEEQCVEAIGHNFEFDGIRLDMLPPIYPQTCKNCGKKRTLNENEFLAATSARPGWDEWFLNIANTVAQRADCSRRRVGCVLVKGNRILGTGYNGALPGEKGCLAGGCPRAFSTVPPGASYAHGPGECISLHGEMNSILYAAKYGISTDPCITCSRVMQQAGIVRVVWPDGELSFDSETS